MAAKLTKLGRLRKIIEKRSDGRISFRLPEPPRLGEDGWVEEVWDGFIFRGRYSQEDLIRSDFFQRIFKNKTLAASYTVRAYKAYMNDGIDGYIEQALKIYHAHFGMDYLDEAASLDEMKECSDVMTRVLSGSRT